MKEYEYSFKVQDLKPYITYCINNNYIEISNSDEIRDLYSNNSGINARITITNNEIVLDYKEEDDSNKILKETLESKQIKINKDELDSIYKELNNKNYKLIKHLERHRIVYIKDNIKFELDEYTYPKHEYVAAIEGNKEEVDKVYEELKKQS